MECKNFLVKENDNCELKKMFAESEKRTEAFHQEKTNLLLKITLRMIKCMKS